jgi:hypothetical protein
MLSIIPFFRQQWLMPVILASQEAERSGGLQFKARPDLVKTYHKNKAGGVAQGIGLAFKP